MHYSIWMAMFGFALSMSISPGPVNMLIIATAAQWGTRRAWAVVSGATIGFTLLLAVVGWGLAGLLQRHPLWLQAMGVVGALFIVFMASKLISSPVSPSAAEKNIAEQTTGQTPEPTTVAEAAPGFAHGFLLQWLNPKAWIAAAAGTALFAQAAVPHALWTFIGIYFFVCYASLALWAWAGGVLSPFLQQGQRMRGFNVLMGVLLCLTAVFMLWQQFFSA